MDWRSAEAAFESDVLGAPTPAHGFEAAADRHPACDAQRYKGGVYDRSLGAVGAIDPAPDGEFASLTYAEMRTVVRRLAAGFRDLGLAPGDRVGVFAHTRMEWAQTDFAVLAAGGAVATLYAASSPRQVRHLLSDSGASAVVVENDAFLDRVLAVEDHLDLSFVAVMDETDCDRDDVLSLGAVYERGREAFDAGAYESWLDALAPDDLASVIYTSGTTGDPKGVALTHDNLRSNVDQCYRRFGPRPDKGARPTVDAETTAISFLPLAHVFERLAGHFLMFAAGATVAYAEGPDALREDFRLVRPTVATSVPRVYGRLYESIRDEASDSPLARRVFEWAADVARETHWTDDPGRWLSVQRAVADRLVFSRVRGALGGRVEFLISGGGSLSPDLCALFHGMGVPVLEGYGLTETSPVVAANPVEAPRVGTLGPPAYGEEVAVDPSVATPEAASDADGEVGELLVRGPNVADGYWNDPEATAAAFVDDPLSSSVVADGGAAAGRWFRTGDVVELRDDGHLVFVERAKQLLVLSTGKNVAPGPIEGAFVRSDVVEQCLAVGDGRKFVAALVVPSVEGVRAWAARDGIDLPADPADLRRDDRVRERIAREMDAVNESLEPHERIKRFRLVPEAFTEENGLLTPTMKKRRRDIVDRYGTAIERLYGGDGKNNRTE